MWVGWSAGASSWAQISMRAVPLSSDSDVEEQQKGPVQPEKANKMPKIMERKPAEEPVQPLEADEPKTTAEGPEEERPRPSVKLVDVGTQTLESALRGEVPEPSMGEASEPMETWSVVTEEPRPAPVDDDQSEEDAEELRALRRLRESVKKCVEGMHSHIAKEIKEAAVKAMPRKAEEEMPRKAVASKAMPKTGKKRGSAAAEKEPEKADKKPKDMRKPAEPEEPPSSSSRVSLVPRDQRVYRFPPPPRVPSIPKPPAVPKAAWPKGLPKPPPAPDAWV